MPRKSIEEKAAYNKWYWTNVQKPKEQAKRRAKRQAEEEEERPRKEKEQQEQRREEARIRMKRNRDKAKEDKLKMEQQRQNQEEQASVSRDNTNMSNNGHDSGLPSQQRQQQVSRDNDNMDNIDNGHDGIEDTTGELTASTGAVPNVVAPVTGLDGNALMAHLAANVSSVTFVNNQPGATNIGTNINNNASTSPGTPEWAKSMRDQVSVIHTLATGSKPASSSNRYSPTAGDASNLADVFESNASSPERHSSPERQPVNVKHGILQKLVDDALTKPNLQADMEHYETLTPSSKLELSYSVHLGNVKRLMSAIEADSSFVSKELSGLSQHTMTVDTLASQSWTGLTKQLSSGLLFFGDKKQVLVYNESKILQKEKHNLVPLVLPVAGFTHEASVSLLNKFKTQLTPTWSENSSEDGATVLFHLIQLAIAEARKRDDTTEDTSPLLVQVEAPAIGNKPAEIGLSPDQFGQLCVLSDAYEPCDHKIEFKRIVFTPLQQEGILKSVGEVILTNCVLLEHGHVLSDAFKVGRDDLVLWKLTVRGSFPFGIEQSLELVESCNKEIIIGSGAAAELFQQQRLMESLKRQAASDGIFYSWKFDVDGYSQREMDQLGNFLADIYTGKLRLEEDINSFATTKETILQELSDAYDVTQDDEDLDSFEWPFQMVDILPPTKYQVALASVVKKKILPLVFVEAQQRPVAGPPSPYRSRPDADTGVIPLSTLFGNQNGTFNCVLCRNTIAIGSSQCASCGCVCKPGQVDTNCVACQKNARHLEKLKMGIDDAVLEQNPDGLDASPEAEAGISEAGFVFEPSGKTKGTKGFSFGTASMDETNGFSSGQTKGTKGFSFGTASTNKPSDFSVGTTSKNESSGFSFGQTKETKDSSVGVGDGFSVTSLGSAPTKTTSASGSCFKLAAPNGDIVGNTPALVEESSQTLQSATGSLVKDKTTEALKEKTTKAAEEKKPDEPRIQASEPTEIQASNAPNVQGKLQAGERVVVNSKVREGPKRAYVGKHGTVSSLSGSWVYVKFDDEEKPIAFYPVWLD